DGGDGCVGPDTGTIEDGSYPISRPLFIYPSGAAAENDAVSSFVDFYLSDTGYATVPEAGYINVPEADWDATNQAWEDFKANPGGGGDAPTGDPPVTDEPTGQ
ncbi:MAG: hypothetical protein ACRDWD_05430, partial [Acidimicrobiia bacterium]